MIEIASGHSGIDHYPAAGFWQVRGMSSRFAAAICGHLIHRQSRQGVVGGLVEIGTFEGRFFIAMALGLDQGEIALGIDRFDWPDTKVKESFLANCVAHGVPRDRVLPWKTDSREITVDQLRKKLGERAPRLVHIDGHHSPECLTNDLELVHSLLHPRGIICVDDMLHPCYPTLTGAVSDYLRRYPTMRILCVIDREDIVAATKFLICHKDAVSHYEAALRASFRQFHFGFDADMGSYSALLLTPSPPTAAFSPGQMPMASDMLPPPPSMVSKYLSTRDDFAKLAMPMWLRQTLQALSWTLRMTRLTIGRVSSCATLRPIQCRALSG